MQTDLDTSPIEARLAAATPGPWKVVPGKSFGVQAENKNIAACFRPENEVFIAHAPSDLAALLSELKRTREERDVLRKHLMYQTLNTKLAENGQSSAPQVVVGAAEALFEVFAETRGVSPRLGDALTYFWMEWDAWRSGLPESGGEDEKVD